MWNEGRTLPPRRHGPLADHVRYASDMCQVPNVRGRRGHLSCQPNAVGKLHPRHCLTVQRLREKRRRQRILALGWLNQLSLLQVSRFGSVEFLIERRRNSDVWGRLEGGQRLLASLLLLSCSFVSPNEWWRRRLTDRQTF